ncbi:GrpB family protein [Pedobacter sp. N36a]|uniref:GrpB family protein n=1 Tax=Pedobacter sp. N36a TaxID=2767996 RepID=UPI0016569BD7|nr:GrpB family protein [Pedobacter sp. N36a]MBC8984550.1 GrpB family protein [Pedobacter sp. N36a]
MKPTILVVDYHPSWPKQFEDLKRIFNDALGNLVIAIEHVGSTSVPGLASKPILDIDLIVKEERQLNEVIPILVTLGYQSRGEMGIKGRYAFHAISEFSPEQEENITRPKHHLYCCIEGSLGLNNHLLFRNALRKSPVLITQYGELKKKLASLTDDIDHYVESKSAFIASVLTNSGLSSDHIKDVIHQNKKK